MYVMVDGSWAGVTPVNAMHLACHALRSHGLCENFLVLVHKLSIAKAWERAFDLSKTPSANIVATHSNGSSVGDQRH